MSLLTELGSKSITFRANSITLRILKELTHYYETHTLGPVPISQSRAILAAIWDAYQLRTNKHPGELATGGPGPNRPKKRNRRPA